MNLVFWFWIFRTILTFRIFAWYIVFFIIFLHYFMSFILFLRWWILCTYIAPKNEIPPIHKWEGFRVLPYNLENASSLLELNTCKILDFLLFSWYLSAGLGVVGVKAVNYLSLTDLLEGVAVVSNSVLK